MGYFEISAKRPHPRWGKTKRRATLGDAAKDCIADSLLAVQAIDQPLNSAIPFGLGPHFRRVLRYRVEQVAHSPQAVDHSGRHRGRATDRTVDAAEIVDRNMD